MWNSYFVPFMRPAVPMDHVIVSIVTWPSCCPPGTSFCFFLLFSLIFLSSKLSMYSIKTRLHIFKCPRTKSHRSLGTPSLMSRLCATWQAHYGRVLSALVMYINILPVGVSIGLCFFIWRWNTMGLAVPTYRQSYHVHRNKFKTVGKRSSHWNIWKRTVIFQYQRCIFTGRVHLKTNLIPD